MEDKISIILEAVERAKGVLNQTLADIKKLDDQNKKSDSTWARLTQTIKEHDKILLTIQVSAAAVVAATLLMGRSAIKTADDYLVMAQAAGTTVETFSTLVFAANQSHVQLNELAIGMKTLQVAAVAASQGAADQTAAFSALGVSIKNTDGTLKSSTQLLFDVADAFSRAADGPAKATIAQRLFGRSSQELIGFLNKGSEAIREQQAQAKALGLEISTKTAKAASQFGENMAILKGILQGMANQIVAQLLPVLLNVQQFFIDNPAFIKATTTAIIALAAAVVIGTAAWKAYALAGNIAAATLGVGAVKNARDYLAAIQLIGATSFVAYAAGIAGAVAIVWAGVEAWKAYKARQEEAITADNLTAQTARTDAALKKQIKSLVDAGKITELEAARINRAITQAGAATGDAARNQSARAEQFARNAIRGANGQASLPRTPGGGPALPGTPEAAAAAEGKKTLTLPDVGLEKAQIDATTKLFEAGLANRDQDFQNSLKVEQTALDDALRRRTITVDEWRKAQQAIDEKTVQEAQQIENAKYDVQKDNLQKTLALSQDPKERVAIQGEIEALEVAHEGRMDNIAAQGAATRLETDRKYYDNRAALVAESLQTVQTKEQAAAAAFQEQLDNIHFGSTIGDGLSEFQEIDRAQDDYLAKLREQKTALEEILAVMKEINLANPGTFKTEDIDKVTKAIKQNGVSQVETQRKVSDQKLQIQQDELGATTTLLGAAADAAKAFGKKGFLAWKAIALAQAVVSGAAAVLLQLGGGDPYSAVFRAAAAAAVAAVQIATIAATQPQGYAGGGLITGPGTGTSDDVPVMASHREFMVRNAIVEQPGALEFLHNFNMAGMDALEAHTVPNAPRPARFAAGGLIGDMIEAATSARAGASQQASVGILNTRNQQRRFMRQEGAKIVVDELRARGNNLVA